MLDMQKTQKFKIVYSFG